MSIQRFVIGADHLVPAEQAEGVWESPAEVVLYADHVAAVAEQRAQIRQAVEAMGLWGTDEMARWDAAIETVLGIIDGQGK